MAVKYQTSLTAVGLALVTFVVCVAVVVTHWPGLSAKALSSDDQEYLTRNVLVQKPSIESTKRFLTEVIEPSTVKGYYQPLAMISLMLDYAMGGRENNLRPFHVTSIALHTANTALVIVLLYLLFGNIWAAAAAGLLFGVHPMTVEPIPWVGERKTLLAAFFALWSLILYVRYSRNGGWKSYAGCFLMYLLALMSKPTSVPLPVVMLLMDYWPLKRLTVKSVLEKIPLFMLSAVFAVITYASQHHAGGTVSPVKHGPAHVILVLCHNIIFYLYKIVLPVNLSSYYAFPKPFEFSSPMVFAGVIGTCILIPVLLISLQWTRAALTGWLIFFTAIFPAIGVVGFTVVIAADKYAYLPSVGLLMVLTSFLIWLCRNNKARIIAAAIIMLLLAGAEAFATQRYLRHWQNTISLCEYTLAKTPNAPEIQVNLGIALMEQNKYDEAINHFRDALRIKPDYAAAYNNIGNAYDKLGRHDEAAEAYKQATKVGAHHAETYYNLGVYYNNSRRYTEAIEAFKQALKVNPELPQAYFNLAIAYGSVGRVQDEIDSYRNVISIKPYYAEAYNNLGVAYGKLGRYQEARQVFSQAVQLKPDFVNAHYGLGVSCMLTGDKNTALKEYEILKKLDMSQANRLFNIISKR